MPGSRYLHVMLCDFFTLTGRDVIALVNNVLLTPCYVLNAEFCVLFFGEGGCNLKCLSNPAAQSEGEVTMPTNREKRLRHTAYKLI